MTIPSPFLYKARVRDHPSCSIKPSQPPILLQDRVGKEGVGGVGGGGRLVVADALAGAVPAHPVALRRPPLGQHHRPQPEVVQAAKKIN